MEQQPLISVIIPVYNGQDTLHNTVASTLRQTHSNIEIIIVDDGSEISPEVIIQQFDDNRICLYSIEHANANVARNYGIERSKGEYIAMLDADDQWLDNHLEDCLTLLKQTNADGIYGSLIMGHKKESIQDVVHKPIFYARALNEGETMMDYLLTSVMGAQTSSLFTTSVSAKDILWDPELIDHQDYDFVLRFSKKYRWIPKEEPTVLYYRFSGRKNNFPTAIRFVEKNKTEVHPDIYNQYNLKMMMLAINEHASEEIVGYFRKEATRYVEYLSYQLYLSIREPKSAFRIWIDKIKYLWHLIGVKIEL